MVESRCGSWLPSLQSFVVVVQVVRLVLQNRIAIGMMRRSYQSLFVSVATGMVAVFVWALIHMLLHRLLP
jgi:hypothetical protein